MNTHIVFLYVYMFLYRSVLLTINSPRWSDYFQTVQQSQEKQSCYQHVGHGAQHCSLSWQNISHQSPLGPVKAGGCRQAATCNPADDAPHWKSAFWVRNETDAAAAVCSLGFVFADCQGKKPRLLPARVGCLRAPWMHGQPCHKG